VANSGNQSKKAASTPTAAATKAATPAPAANQAGTCTPQPCANDNFGWVVNASNLRYDIASGNDFEKPEAGNVFVAVDVSFTNRLKTEQHANPTEFVLQDGAGIKHQTTFMTTACPVWEPVNVTPGATLGPKCIAFQASAGKPNGLVLVWTPSLVGGGYNMKLS
jgi:hypothetical protein